MPSDNERKVDKFLDKLGRNNDEVVARFVYEYFGWEYLFQELRESMNSTLDNFPYNIGKEMKGFEEVLKKAKEK